MFSFIVNAVFQLGMGLKIVCLASLFVMEFVDKYIVHCVLTTRPMHATASILEMHSSVTYIHTILNHS